jgi:exodeoxyribonuclease V alpha subunit
MEDLPYKVFADFFEQRQPGLGILAGLVLRKLEEGHLCLDPTLEEEKLSPGILEPGPYLTHDSKEVKPFILYKGNVYFQRYFKYETNIVQKISALVEEEQHVRQKRKELLYQHFSQEDVEQMLPALLNNFCIITGGPGTGKTWLIGNILCALYAQNPNLKVALAAPTGKAAARMNESLVRIKQECPQLPIASTIHRLLGTVRGSVFFRHNADNRLEHDVVVIDESSMIDGALMAKLMDAVDPHKRLILVGDKDQLASVQAGSVFGDLCKAAYKGSALEKHVIRLTVSRRFDSKKGIGKFSQSVLAGNTTCIEQTITHPDDELRIDTQYNENLFRSYVSDYLKYIQETDIKEALKKLSQIRVLCAVREGEYGVYKTNRRIADFLHEQTRGNSETSQRLQPSPGFYHNQPIMVTANMYDLGLFNGDVGLVRYEKSGGKLYAWFPGPDGEIKKVPTGYLMGYETVFAMTINKSQGSEFDKILVLLPHQKEIRILTRELLYTAVTRAKEDVLVQGSKEVLEETVKNKISRVSGLEARLNE